MKALVAIALTALIVLSANAQDIQRGMQDAMGPLPPTPEAAVQATVVSEVDCGTYVRRRVDLLIAPNDVLPAYLLVPKPLKGRAPAMLCLHQTAEEGKDVVVGLGDQKQFNYASELAERGFVTLAPDYTGFGELKENRKVLYAAGYASATMKGIFNHRRCVDYLQGLPEVDPEKIGAIGHSLGGHNTLFLGGFEPRVKVMVTSCGFTEFKHYYKGDLTGWSHDGYMPRIKTEYGLDPAKMPFDFPQLLASLAPRWVFVNAPVHDANFEPAGVRSSVAVARAAYEAQGVPERLVAVYPEAEHSFPPEVREEAYRFIAQALALP
jgi:hypothetical protein